LNVVKYGTDVIQVLFGQVEFGVGRVPRKTPQRLSLYDAVGEKPIKNFSLPKK
jgi:hypothetical protein